MGSGVLKFFLLSTLERGGLCTIYPVIQVINLEKTFGGRELFAGSSFTVARGERVGVVGRNGSGKTTLLRLILGEDSYDGGDIQMPRGYRLGHLTQHISLTQGTVLEEACSAFTVRSAEDAHEEGDQTFRAQKILQGLGFTPAMFDTDPALLSGGYQVRLQLARALLSEPDMLLLDEPTNYLDILSIRWLTGFLRSWPGELLLITHDRTFMDSVITHCMAIHRGKFIKSAGTTDKLYEQIMADEEHYEKTRVKEEKRRKEVERFIARFRVQARRASVVQSRVKMLEKRRQLDKLQQERDLEFSFVDKPFIGKFMMSVEDLAFGFPEGPELISDLSMTVTHGERIAIVGRNGAGKTTLLNLLAGELKPTAGHIRLNPKAEPAYFGQTNVERLAPGRTVLEEILSGDAAATPQQGRNVAGAMLFEGDEALKRIEMLSGGERARVLLGRMLLRPSNLLLLDEPTNHLDMQSVDSLIEALDAFAGTVIVVTHNELLLDALAERLIVFDDAKVRLFEGTYREFLQRVGFASEAAERPSAQSANAQVERSAEQRRLEKRERAQLIQERSRLLGPLKKRMQEIEEEITVIEERVNHDTDALVLASQQGNGQAIAELGKSIHEGNERIEALFGELERKNEEHDTLSKKYAQQLGEDA